MKRNTVIPAAFLLLFLVGFSRGDDKDYLDETLPKTIATNVYDQLAT